MTPEEAEKAADDFQRDLSRSKFEQETQRDKAVLLIAGGALTATFAFIASFTEHHPLIDVGWLFGAWGAWTATLIATMVGYSVSIAVFDQAIQPLSKGEWGKARETPWAAKYIERVNLASSLFAISGFLLFGHFAYTNLSERANAQVNETKVCKEEGRGKEVRAPQSNRELTFPSSSGPWRTSQ